MNNASAAWAARPGGRVAEVIEVCGHLSEPAFRRIGELLGLPRGRHKSHSVSYTFGPMATSQAGEITSYLQQRQIAYYRETTTGWTPAACAERGVISDSGRRATTGDRVSNTVPEPASEVCHCGGKIRYAECRDCGEAAPGAVSEIIARVRALSGDDYKTLQAAMRQWDEAEYVGAEEAAILATERGEPHYIASPPCHQPAPTGQPATDNGTESSNAI